ncbi:MAG: alcohol dehydrogenase catalytic domain-containing protein [Patescibacteria group bacterium]
MKALIFDTDNQEWATSRGFELRDVATPVLDETHNQSDADAVLIKVHYAGVCGSDRGIWMRSAFRDQILQSIAAQDRGKRYRIIGHELFGEIVGKGSRVNTLAIGDRVTCESHVVCNQCYQCLRGEKHVCTNEKILGISQDGGFAELIKVPSHIVWKTNTSNIRPEVAVMQEPFGNAVHAASKTDLHGKTIAIFGLGPIGLFLTLIAKQRGAKKIIGIDPNPQAREMAMRMGIDHCVALLPADGGTQETVRPYAHNQRLIEEIMKLTDMIGVDVSFEMAGFNSSVNNCLYATRRGGEVILFGIKNGDGVIEDYNRLIVRGLTLHCVIGRQIWQTWETVRMLLEDTSNGIQKNIFDMMLNKGIDTIIPIVEYSKEVFERKMALYPKILIKF